MSILAELHADTSLLEARYVNPDAAGLILDRLTQPQLEQLVAWYEHPKGGALGMALLDEAPLLDAWLQGLVPNLPPDAKGERTLQTLVAFMAGMAAGLAAREDMEDGSAYSHQPDLESSFGFFSIFFELPRFWDVDRRMATTDRLVQLGNRLGELEPSILGVQWALTNMAHRRTPDESESPDRQAWLRFIFHAGQVAAGTEIPDLSTHDPIPPAFAALLTQNEGS